MQFSLKATRLGLRNSTTRIPFRYGNTCLSHCPQAVLEATIETGGNVQRGYSGDCLPPGWFDKTPGRSFAEQIDDMLAVIARAEKTFLDWSRVWHEFPEMWLVSSMGVHEWARENGYGELLASFGVSLVERAVMDAMCRAAGLSFFQAARSNLFALEPGEIHSQLVGLEPATWLPSEPRQTVWVRHTVGLGDPLTVGDIAPDERVDDGYPQALEEYIEQTGTRYFKVKLRNNLDEDIERLIAFAEIVERHRGDDYRLTLDGNEQYKRAEEFDELIDRLRRTERLRMLLSRTLAIEQPLDRAIALDEAHTHGIRKLSQEIPVIIDESDGDLHSYRAAIELGYRGTSSKNCKGPIKSLLNAGLTWLYNDRGTKHDYLVTGEDLCSVGVIATQADLCLAATLGLEHVERNGHHYHPGLSYLPESEQRAALAAHRDFYSEQHGRISPTVRDGKFEIGSLQCVGFGFAALPDMDSMVPPEEWREVADRE